MRQRITFIHPPSTSFDPASIKLTSTSLSAPDLSPAVREDRITVGLSELPPAIVHTLEKYHELHIRWATDREYETIEPWGSRVTPGVHIYYTPLQADDAGLTGVCEFVAKAFGELGCKDPESWIRQLTERFSSSTAYQFYQPLSSLDHLITFLTSTFGSPQDAFCSPDIKSLSTAATLDISYDTISHAVKLTATTPLTAIPLAIIAPPGNSHRTEVGILTKGVPPKMNEGDIGLTGVLSVLGEHTKPSPVLFSFPARHRVTEGASFTADFIQPTGLHPTWRLEISSTQPPLEDARCAPHVYLTLPKTIFVDRYQLADALFVQSKNISAARYISEPVDLEKPEYTTATWGSTVLLELQQPSPGTEGPWSAEIPLHLRYLRPSPSGYTNVTIPYPAVFWACHSKDGTKFPTNPFDRVNLGYDGLFGPRTVFWHVRPKATDGADGKLGSKVRVPVLKEGSEKLVEWGTAGAILVGFLWVVWCLVGGWKAEEKGKVEGKKVEGKKEQ